MIAISLERLFSEPGIHKYIVASTLPSIVHWAGLCSICVRWKSDRFQAYVCAALYECHKSVFIVHGDKQACIISLLFTVLSESMINTIFCGINVIFGELSTSLGNTRMSVHRTCFSFNRAGPPMC